MNDVEIPFMVPSCTTHGFKIFQKSQVPQVGADGVELKDDNGERVLGPETSSRQVFDRLAETWRHWEKTGYFASRRCTSI